MSKTTKLKEWVVFQLIKMFPNRNVGRFKIGDKVQYNWMAKWYIWLAIKDKYETVFTIKSFFTKGENVIFTDGGGCSVFWIKKYKPRNKAS